jgi:hypothetical protein
MTRSEKRSKFWQKSSDQEENGEHQNDRQWICSLLWSFLLSGSLTSQLSLILSTSRALPFDHTWCERSDSISPSHPWCDLKDGLTLNFRSFILWIRVSMKIWKSVASWSLMVRWVGVGVGVRIEFMMNRFSIWDFSRVTIHIGMSSEDEGMARWQEESYQRLIRFFLSLFLSFFLSSLLWPRNHIHNFRLIHCPFLLLLVQGITRTILTSFIGLYSISLLRCLNRSRSGEFFLCCWSLFERWDLLIVVRFDSILFGRPFTFWMSICLCGYFCLYVDVWPPSERMTKQW